MDNRIVNSSSLSELERYVDALQQAATAIECARKLRPNHGLDHAIDRLRAMLYDAAVELQTPTSQTVPQR